MIELFIWALFLMVIVIPLLTIASIFIGGLALGLNQVLNIKAIPAILMSLGLIYLLVR